MAEEKKKKQKQLEPHEQLIAFHNKRNAVVSMIAGIIKTGYNESQKYMYAEELEVLKHIRTAFTGVSLAFEIETIGVTQTHDIPTRSGSMKHFLVELVCTLTDCETGFQKSYKWFGGAADSGDKALYKAYTSGLKYFLMKSFLLPTGNDVEAFSLDTTPLTPAQIRAKKAKEDAEKTKGSANKPDLPKPTKAAQKVIAAVTAKLQKNLPLADITKEGIGKAIYGLRGYYVGDMKKVDTIVAYFTKEIRKSCDDKKPAPAQEDTGKLLKMALAAYIINKQKDIPQGQIVDEERWHIAAIESGQKLAMLADIEALNASIPLVKVLKGAD